eukprot:358639-Chlamydomonas_euryale.AAC.4
MSHDASFDAMIFSLAHGRGECRRGTAGIGQPTRVPWPRASGAIRISGAVANAACRGPVNYVQRLRAAAAAM